MFTDPVKNLKFLGLKENAIVADLGAGTGFYSLAAGHIVTKGKVYAVEIVKDFLATIKNKVKEAHLNNVEIIWGDIEKIDGTKIRDGVVDVVIASNILYQVEDKNKFIEEIKRILRPRGRVLLVDWSTDSVVVGLKMAIPKKKAREMFERKGFLLEQDINAGAHHYGMILIKS
ncbi:MAG: Methylase involved in ubiquinone/menaquinone biosynthesis [Parcubacteria group bacterium GW2011_GWC1_36_9]|uniref:Methylase involved in ubiquinone/menaquinone biosynthesis n=1 Tax=Candidatus Yanofskybacteria bacterium GW2011_GWC2_37_9 TaxID=1619028 RepID=A0A0G0L2R8_9BACT|nr:MAG: Methylase involved in ubiquinone/menaquinone biosynthesis [Parcubacteria group bacterium GW2011_GWC1_36_9]KKQ46981.1 MAG: Methylase involved in ubiquinone/menaquinone biosynthesis [Candidatus Yanofskybacteria bacterium GW2011_GWC2_37_9]